MSIIHYHYDGEGKSVREYLKEKGIQVELAKEAEGYEQLGFATTMSNDLYSYTRPSDNRQLWLVERSYFTRPDVQYSETWILDTEPTPEEMKALKKPEKRQEKNLTPDQEKKQKMIYCCDPLQLKQNYSAQHAAVKARKKTFSPTR